MKVLITGNLGYVGPVVVRHLRQRWPNAHLVGLDNGYFGHALSNAEWLPERYLNEQRFADVRTLSRNDIIGFDAVIHLAAVSNDPMGSRFAVVTNEINHQSSVRLAQFAKEAGVRYFVFASSCSVYGAAPGEARRETDQLNPQTAYAKSKVDTEEGIAALDLGNMLVTVLRFATAAGMSDRLRLDLVLNDFVASAVASSRIDVLSDGSPWRPLIDVRDMARAMEWAVSRSRSDGGHLVKVNVGCEAGNFQVRDLADAVAAEFPGIAVSINSSAPSDYRSYKVDFSLFRSLAPEHQPQVTLAETIRGLKSGLSAMGFSDQNFRSSPFIRLKMLEAHVAGGRLSPDLHWCG